MCAQLYNRHGLRHKLLSEHLTMGLQAAKASETVRAYAQVYLRMCCSNMRQIPKSNELTITPVTMTKQCHSHRLQTNPQRHYEETPNTESHNTMK